MSTLRKAVVPGGIRDQVWKSILSHIREIQPLHCARCSASYTIITRVPQTPCCSAPDNIMPGSFSRLIDKSKSHFRQTLSPTDDAYLSCEPLCA